MKTYEFSRTKEVGVRRPALFSEEEFEMFKIAEGKITLWGICRTPGNGLIHAFYSQYDYTDPGQTLRLHYNLKHAYSDDGETWIIQEVPLGIGLEYGINAVRVAATDERVHLFYGTSRKPRTVLPALAVSDITVLQQGDGGSAPHNITFAVVGSVAHRDSRQSGFRLFNANSYVTVPTRVRIDNIPGTPEPNVTHIRVYAQRVTSGGTDEVYGEPPLIGVVLNPYPGVASLEGDLNGPGATLTNALFLTKSRRRYVYMKTGVDGITWDAASIAEVDADTVPPRTGTVGATPTGQRVGLGFVSAVIPDDAFSFSSQTTSAGLAVDVNEVPAFLYAFIGYEGNFDITANKIKAIYYKQNPGDARFAIKETLAGAAVDVRCPEVWRQNDVVLTIWRALNTLNWRSLKSGIWTAEATLWTDTAEDFFFVTRLHDGIVLLMTRDGEPDELVQFNFDTVTQAWGSESIIASDTIWSMGFIGSGLEGSALRVMLVDGAQNDDVWYVGAETKEVFNGDTPPALSPVFDANDSILLRDGVRDTGLGFYLEHRQLNDVGVTTGSVAYFGKISTGD